MILLLYNLYLIDQIFLNILLLQNLIVYSLVLITHLEKVNWNIVLEWIEVEMKYVI